MRPSSKAQVQWGRRRQRRFFCFFCLLIAVGLDVGGMGAGAGIQGAGAQSDGFRKFARYLSADRSLASAALRSLLQAAKTDVVTCSIVVLADHSVTADAVMEGAPLGYAQGGTTMLQLPAFLDAELKRAPNVTINTLHHLKGLMKIARRSRLRNGCVTIIFVTDSMLLLRTMMELSVEDRLLVWDTHGVVVTNLPDTVVIPGLEGLWTFTMMNLHLLHIRPAASGGSAVVFRHEPYSPVGKRTKAVAHYTPQQGISVSAPILYEKFSNFFGAPLSFTAPCVASEILPNGTKVYHFSGVAYELLVLLGDTLHFRPDFLETESVEMVIVEVTKRKSFVVPFLFYVSLNRLEQIDMLAPCITSDNAFVMMKPGLVANWDAFMWPFTMGVWLYTLGVMIIMPMCLVLVLTYSSGDHIKTSKIRGGQISDNIVKISKTRAVFEVIGAILGQDFSFRMPHTYSFRILLTGCFIFIIVLSTGYKSNLISFMTSPKVPTRFETLKEIIESNTTLNIPKDYQDLYKMLRASVNTEYQTLASRMTYVKSVINGLEKALAEGTAHMDDRVYLTASIANHFTKADGTTDLYLGKEKVLTNSVSFPIPHDAPYKQQFDVVMRRIVEGGLYPKMVAIGIEKLRVARMELVKSTPEGAAALKAAKHTSNVKPLTLANLQGPFWLLICGATLSLLGFLQEQIKAWCMRPRATTAAITG